MAYWSNVHASTQYKQFYLLFGHEVILPVDVMFGRQPNHQAKVSEHIRDFITPLKRSMSMPGSTFELTRSIKRLL